MKKVLLTLFMFISLGMWSWEGMEMPKLHVEGRFLMDESGNVVNLHGFGQTYSPWFNEQMTQWNNYDVSACLSYNQGLIDDIMEAGWKVNFLRLHMDPYWSNTPGKPVAGENDISAFDFSRFRQYLSSVFIPMAEYAVSKGLYVVMRPPGVCPEEIAVGDDYHKYLKRVWGYISTEPALVSNPHIMFELANEPVRIKGTDGVYGAGSDACNEALTQFFQEIVDLMRNNGCENILWIPGTGYQSQYAGFAKYPIVGDNIGYAIHVYPGWYGSDAIEPSHELGGNYGGGFPSFASGWASQILPAAEIAPIMVTEMDWAPSAYNASWGKSITGKMFGEGFGGNFKLLADMTENVSWMIFTGPELLAKFDASAKHGNTFLTDPEACPWPVYHWFKEYADESEEGKVLSSQFLMSPSWKEEITVMPGSMIHYAVVSDNENGYQSNQATETEVTIEDSSFIQQWNGSLRITEEGNSHVSVTYLVNGEAAKKEFEIISTNFPFAEGLFNPSIWEKGSFDAATHEIKTGMYGFAGWHYAGGLNLSGKETIVAELEGDNNASVSFRLFDIDNYWSDPAIYDFGNQKTITVKLNDMRSNDNGRFLDPSHLYYIGFWSNGSSAFKIKNVYTTEEENSIDKITEDGLFVDVFNLQGVKIKTKVRRDKVRDLLSTGVYIIGSQKILIKQK